MRTVLRLPAHLPAETGWRVVPVDSGPQAGPGFSLRSRCDPLPRFIQVVLPRALSDSEIEAFYLAAGPKGSYQVTVQASDENNERTAVVTVVVE